MEKHKLQVNGFIFTMDQLEKIRTLVKQDKLTASSIALYIGLNSEASLAGLIDFDVKLNHFAKKIGLAVSTTYEAYHCLIKNNLIVKNGSQIEIVDYKVNRERKKKHNKESKNSNYFRVPFRVFETTILSELVRAFSTRGLILLLEQCNAFRFQFIEYQYSSQNVHTELSLSTLKEKLRVSSAIRVRKVLDILKPLFVFTPDNLLVRKPRENVLDRVRAAVSQVWVDKYNIYIHPDCVIEQKFTADEFVLKVLADAEERIKYMNIPLKHADRVGIAKNFRGFANEIAKFINSKRASLKEKFLRNVMEEVLFVLESKNKQAPGTIQSVGAFANKMFRTVIKQELTTIIHSDDRIVLSEAYLQARTHYEKTKSPMPSIWSVYEEVRMS